MDRHILLTVSDDQSALQAVRFVVNYFTDTDKLNLTLLFVAPNPKAGLSEVEIQKDYANIARREQHCREMAEAALTKAEHLLATKNFPAANIHKKIAFKQFGTATDIIQEGLSGMYDAIALGRRGLSRLEELLADSVSKQIFTTPMEIPLWVCRNQEKPLPHLLLCTDGSPASLRCADHVGFMLKNQTRHEITVAHIATGASSAVPEEVVARARRAIEDNGVDSARIKDLIVTGRNAKDTIVKLAQDGRYGVVASGRTGRGETRSAHLLGSVSMHLLKALDFTTLWISH